jgi:hypothetical protein
LETAAGLINPDKECYRVAKQVVLIHPSGPTPLRASMEVAEGLPPDMDGYTSVPEETMESLLEGALEEPVAFPLHRRQQMLDLGPAFIPEMDPGLADLFAETEIDLEKAYRLYFLQN